MATSRMLDEDLETLYLSAIYQIQLPAALVRFRIGEPVPSRPFALITAYNPGRARPSADENASANERLESVIRSRGYTFAPAVGQSPDGGHSEPSFAVFEIPFAVAVKLAKDFAQGAFVWFDGDVARLAWTDERADGGAT